MAEAELVEVMRVVMMNWKGGEWGLLDREIVGEEVVRETARWDLAETRSLLIDGSVSGTRRGQVGSKELDSLFWCHVFK